MSWVAHDLEPYAFQGKLGKAVSVSFVAVVLGSWGPDMFTKWFAYGSGVFGFHLRADDPVQFHRGWPGAGFTHSLTFGVLAAALVFLFTRSKGWALGLLIGLWAHVLSDTGDTVGAMLFFPFSTEHVSAGAWHYTGHTGRLSDAASYYSGPGLVWDAFWITLGLCYWRILRREYFYAHIAPRDGFWTFAGQRLPEEALLALYRGAFFFGVCRFTGWTIWAHVLHDYPIDISWGGPYWAAAFHS